MIRAPMTGQQAEALAAFLVSLRPGQRRWTKTACYDALTAAGRDRTNDVEALTRAAVRAALTGSIVSPEVIAMDGAHWESIHSTPDPPSTALVRGRCKDCGGMHAWNAPHDPPAAARTDPSPHLTAARKLVLGKHPRRYDKPPTTRPTQSTPLPEEATH